MSITLSPGRSLTAPEIVEVALPAGPAAVIRREGTRVVVEGARRAFSRRFLALAESAADFPYPPEPPAVEPGPNLG